MVRGCCAVDVRGPEGKLEVLDVSSSKGAPFQTSLRICPYRGGAAGFLQILEGFSRDVLLFSASGRREHSFACTPRLCKVILQER